MNCNDTYEKIRKRIEEQQKYMPKYVYCMGSTGPQGPQGIQGPTGPQGIQGPTGIADTITIGTVTTGEPGTDASITDIIDGQNHTLNFTIPRGADGNSNGKDFCCFCVEQMRNIIEQIITLYPNNELFISLDSGDALIGTPGQISLGPNGKSGVFEVKISQGTFREFLSICSIDTITINNATYNESITYLPLPDSISTECCADCDYAVRETLPIGTSDVSIITNTQLTSQGDVIENKPGIVVLSNSNRNNITFISSCRIDLITLPNIPE